MMKEASMHSNLFWTRAGFLLGSIPFSLLLGKLVVKKDIRNVGDGTPGGANAIRAGGLIMGISAIMLDIGKGFIPVFLTQVYGLTNWSMILICLAPIFGHAFSRFMRFKGGKALGTTAGV
jgi:glycerol-3-phosphate acyltransferase PlsY